MRYLKLALALLATSACLTTCGDDPEDGVRHETVEMRDGTLLATDVYMPEGKGPFPTVLIRTPYGKAEDAYAAHRFNPRGIAVVVQDTRGRFESGGVDLAYTTDGEDGYDTCAWIVDRSWSNGKIATIGGSAMGITGYMLAATGPPGLKVVSAESASPDMYSIATYQGGVRRYALTHNWLEDQGSLHFEEQIIEHPLEDAFWDSVQTTDKAPQVTAAGVHMVGWYDIFQQGGLDAYLAYQNEGGEGAAGFQKLIIGPWTHADPGELTYPAESGCPPIGSAEDALIDHAFGTTNPYSDLVPDDVPSVQYFVMGDVDDPAAPGNEWRMADDWPPVAAPVRFHLKGDGRLTEECPDDSSPTSNYSFDPADPSPTVCGANMTINAGPCDQRSVEEREDVLVFETPVLDEPMEITGRMRAHLFVDIDQPDADLMVRLTDVYPDGRSMLVTDGALRLATRDGTTSLVPMEDGVVAEAVVDLWSTSLVFNQGHRLRISVTSSNWPRFSVNRNNGLAYPYGEDGEANTVQVNLHHDSQYGSYVELPVPDRDENDFVSCGD